MTQNVPLPTGADSAVVAVAHPEERAALEALLHAEGVTVYHADSAQEVIRAIEDHQPRLLVMDIRLPDMHAWLLVKSVTEIRPNPQPLFLVLSDEPVVAPPQYVKLVVRPVALATLRHVIRDWGLPPHC